MVLFHVFTTGRCVCVSFRISREFWVGVNWSVVVKSSNQVSKLWVNKETWYSFFTFSTPWQEAHNSKTTYRPGNVHSADVSLVTWPTTWPERSDDQSKKFPPVESHPRYIASNIVVDSVLFQMCKWLISPTRPCSCLIVSEPVLYLCPSNNSPFPLISW